MKALRVKARRFLLRHCVIINETLDAIFWIALVFGLFFLADWFLTSPEEHARLYEIRLNAWCAQLERVGSLIDERCLPPSSQ